ncbi:DUF481 domain-containing protein [Granulosicoccus antarcticus]|uniref:DUF481 domain-containing protein n=1 Tax=Granulosicoccus antarcticus IMCC3135 TaxID=1192854 RepID=A0A2Z2P780_9GAMM|nr:DUF481 domain-containing protein [Granulosicoccus antarcticus]ASJ76547.1 hypothetical protein IMCC3135_32510 [Granulosicoccus antarcticus IMCC3135]
MSRPCSRLAASLAGVLFCVLMHGAAAQSYYIPKDLEQGWDGQVQLGAEASFGATDSSAVSVRTDFTYRGKHAEHEVSARLHHSANTARVSRRDAEGKEVLNSQGVPVTDEVRTTTNNRRFISAQPRWFFSPIYYAFALVDADINEPAGIKLASRQVAGLGYKLWKTRTHYLSAAFGIGRKKLDQVAAASEEGAIGYFGLRLKRTLSETVSVALALDSDFGGENRFSEAETSLSWRVRGPVALKFKYEASVNSKVVNPWNSFDDGVEAAFSINLEVEVF